MTGRDNTTAIRLYQALGFEIRRAVLFSALRSPGRNPQ
ncbi:GNAT family N-acetyltransferase [Dactylosporangium cerinum]